MLSTMSSGDGSYVSFNVVSPGMYDSPRFNGILHDSARECVRLARMSDDPEVQVELFQLARERMALAIQEEYQAREPSLASPEPTGKYSQ